jgi:Uma2 family endonuclease
MKQEANDMTVTAPTRPLSGSMDLDEFAAFLKTRPNEERWHLVEGIAMMMAPPTLAHQRIAGNLCELLNRSFAARSPDLYAYHEIAVRVPGVVNFQPEPAVVVAPGISGHEPYPERFFLVAEVLSPSNTRAEIDLKLRRYRESPDNLYTLVIDPHNFFIEIHAKSRNWQPVKLSLPDDLVELPELSLTCRVRDLYRGTPLAPQGRATP